MFDPKIKVIVLASIISITSFMHAGCSAPNTQADTLSDRERFAYHPADYDGDQITDIAIFRPSDGTWQGIESSGGSFNVQFGATGDIPVPSVDIPSSALVSISGRVFTANGAAGLKNASVSITDANGQRRSVFTNSFGFYQFNEVVSGGDYTIGVSSKRYRFSPRSLQVSSDLTNVDFIGQE